MIVIKTLKFITNRYRHAPSELLSSLWGKKKRPISLNWIGIVIFSFIFISSLGCDDSPVSKVDPVVQKQQEAKISTFLRGAQINLSKIDNTLQYQEETVELNQNFKAFSGSTRLAVRKRGFLLEDNKIITTLTVYTKIDYTSRTYVLPKNPVYAVLFDGNSKELISAALLGPYLSVISVLPDDSNTFNISALSRQVNGEQFTSNVKNFTVNIEEDVVIVEK
ncbi:MAG: hypothetical protein OXM55_07240 [Bdellovibrionales bacterium]|nr:hypothetical protein [Bdellovibrionales bacterium]